MLLAKTISCGMLSSVLTKREYSTHETIIIINFSCLVHHQVIADTIKVTVTHLITITRLFAILRHLLGQSD